MRRAYLWLLGLLALSGCDQLNTILYSPQQTGQDWLTSQPYVELEIASQEFILVQPSSTIFVYLLGILAIAIGVYFFQIQGSQLSRKWWGMALLFWGIGALLAGTSYQAFSYEIKCAGHEFCLWTSWWEILYMIFSVASVNAMMLAVAYSSAVGKTRKTMSVYALANFSIYSLITLIGSIIPVKFLISFELMLVFLAPSILFLFVLNIGRYRKRKQPIDLALVGTWLWLGITIAAYYTYLVLGITEDLWHQGTWFSENDVLHIGLILWMLYIGFGLAKKVKDTPQVSADTEQNLQI
jgi:hypothetical protein